MILIKMTVLTQCVHRQSHTQLCSSNSPHLRTEKLWETKSKTPMNIWTFQEFHFYRRKNKQICTCLPRFIRFDWSSGTELPMSESSIQSHNMMWWTSCSKKFNNKARIYAYVSGISSNSDKNDVFCTKAATTSWKRPSGLNKNSHSKCEFDSSFQNCRDCDERDNHDIRDHEEGQVNAFLKAHNVQLSRRAHLYFGARRRNVRMQIRCRWWWW